MAVKRVGIVGSGIMGAGVAEVAAKAGFEVVLRSRAQSTADAMVAGLEKSLAKQVDKGKLDAKERDAVLGRVRAVADLHELAECDLVLESIVEDLDAKKHLFTELDRICPEHTILATNTSTLPVVEMAMNTGRPDKVCGIHFFNPAPMMALVEVVSAITSSDETIATATAFATTCGKNAVQVKDQAGFIVNALLFPYLNNAVRLFDAGVATARRHRRRDEGRLQLPDGPARAARPRGARHQPGDPRSALRRVQGPELRPGAAAAPHGERRAPRPQDGRRVLRIQALTRTGVNNRRLAQVPDAGSRPFPNGGRPPHSSNE